MLLQTLERANKQENADRGKKRCAAWGPRDLRNDMAERCPASSLLCIRPGQGPAEFSNRVGLQHPWRESTPRKACSPSGSTGERRPHKIPFLAAPALTQLNTTLRSFSVARPEVGFPPIPSSVGSAGAGVLLRGCGSRLRGSSSASLSLAEAGRANPTAPPEQCWRNHVGSYVSSPAQWKQVMLIPLSLPG